MIEKDTPATTILMLDRLMHHALDLELYAIVRIYCTEIINTIALLEQSVIEFGV